MSKGRVGGELELLEEKVGYLRGAEVGLSVGVDHVRAGVGGRSRGAKLERGGAGCSRVGRVRRPWDAKSVTSTSDRTGRREGVGGVREEEVGCWRRLRLRLGVGRGRKGAEVRWDGVGRVRHCRERHGVEGEGKGKGRGSSNPARSRRFGGSGEVGGELSREKLRRVRYRTAEKGEVDGSMRVTRCLRVPRRIRIHRALVKREGEGRIEVVRELLWEWSIAVGMEDLDMPNEQVLGRKRMSLYEARVRVKGKTTNLPRKRRLASRLRTRQLRLMLRYVVSSYVCT